MKKISEYINSGVIESYVFGLATPSEVKELEEMAAANGEIRAAIDEFSQLLEQHCVSNTLEPNPTIKPLLMATLNYIDRMEKGETMSFPPKLDEGSKITDYNEWLTREDMSTPPDFKDIHARIIGHTAEVTTAIVWIKDMAPAESHTNEFEKFLIVEGSCEIMVEKEVYQLVSGDFFAIPLFKSHMVKVTSNIPCKIILQRVAA
jgi:mannose-6-phosphate isomerase-like protein (cupin superfamily)